MKSLQLALIGFSGLVLGVAPARAQTCTTDANCTAPLTCKPGSTRCSQSASPLPDGGMLVSEPVCEVGPGTCTWTLVACTVDSECALAHWACLQLPAVGASHVCFPEGIVCAAGQTCPAGWSCVDFSTVAETDLAEMWGPNGESKYCFPDALRGVADKTTKVDNAGINPGNLDGGSESGSGGLGMRGVSDGGTVYGNPSISGDSQAAKPGSSGCTLGGRGSAALPWCLLAGFLAAWRFRRRAPVTWP